MKLSQVLFFLPSTLALPPLHTLGNVDVSISVAEDCYMDMPFFRLARGCEDGYVCFAIRF